MLAQKANFNKTVVNVKASQSSHVRELRLTDVPGEVEVTTCKTRKTVKPAKIRKTYTFVNITAEMWEAVLDVFYNGGSFGKAMHGTGWYTSQPR